MTLLEKLHHAVWNETRPLCVNMTIAKTALAMGEETLRHHEMKLILGSRHRYVQEPPLFLDPGRRADTKIRRNAAIHNVEHEHRGPFLALSRMDG